VGPTGVRDGEEAISYLSGFGRYANRELYPIPGLFLLDLTLPVTDGFEVLRWLRSYPSFAAIPVIVFSDCFDPRIVRRAYELGANSFLQKPSNVERRREMIHALQAADLERRLKASARSA